MKALKIFAVLSILSLNVNGTNFQNSTLKTKLNDTTQKASLNVESSAFEIDNNALLAQETALQNAEAYMVSPKVLLPQAIAAHKAESYLVNNKAVLVQTIATQKATEYMVSPVALLVQSFAQQNAESFEVAPASILAQEIAQQALSTFEADNNGLLNEAINETAAPATKTQSNVVVKLLNPNGEVIDEAIITKTELLGGKNYDFVQGSFFIGMVDGTAYYLAKNKATL